jgi:hypothetical protein
MHLILLYNYCVILGAFSINTARPVTTVKLLNGTQNIWALYLSDRKI